MGGLTKEHYLAIRNHFIFLLGGKCQCGEIDCNRVCDNTNNDKFHIHHKDGTHLLNGYHNNNSYQGRGRDLRAWELFKAWKENNLMLLHKDCHLIYEQKQKHKKVE